MAFTEESKWGKSQQPIENVHNRCIEKLNKIDDNTLEEIDWKKQDEIFHNS